MAGSLLQKLNARLREKEASAYRPPHSDFAKYQAAAGAYQELLDVIALVRDHLNEEDDAEDL